MSAVGIQLARRIRDELSELEKVASRVAEGWLRARTTADDYYLDSVALNLHGFYSGLERTFELIAQRVDHTKPTGENWHQALLQQMAAEVPGIRPAVVSNGVCRALDPYRGFRHVVRNIYAYSFDAAKVKRLVEDLPDLLDQITAELNAFASFLEFSETQGEDPPD